MRAPLINLVFFMIVVNAMGSEDVFSYKYYEELGREALYSYIYLNHPCGHANIGRVSSLEMLTLQDVKDFYAGHYSRGNLMIGLTGGYTMSRL
jgi:predicted Zn-dependent peptidase